MLHRREFLKSAGGLVLSLIAGSEFSLARRANGLEDATIFASTTDELSRGIFEDTILDRAEQGITLQHSSAGKYVKRGTYCSPPIAIPASGKLHLNWTERWTTPTLWEKDAANPIITPQNLDERKSTTVTTPFIVETSKERRLYYAVRPKGISVALAA